MSLTSALTSALSGLRATQSQMQVVSGNVANVGTAGYSRRSANLEEAVGNGDVSGVRVIGVQRALDTILQRELRTETAGSGYTAARSDYADQLQVLFGKPGDASSLAGVMSDFTTSLQQLVNDPANSAARGTVLSRATSLATSLNKISGGIQDLRANAESAIGADVKRANELLKSIADADAKVAQTLGADPSVLDRRDAQINELSKLIDLRVMPNDNGTVSISTQAGLRLYDASGPTTLSFDARGTIGPTSLYSNGTSRGVGTITATSPGGSTIDALAQGLIRSGEIAGLLEVRDRTLVDAQAQVDELAAALSSALSDRPVAGVAATAGAATGFDVNVAGIQPGNVFTVKVTDAGVARTFSFVNVAAGGTLPANATADPTDTEVAIDFSNPTTAAAAMQAAMGGAKFPVTASGTTLRILDDGAAGTTDVTSATAGITMMTPTSGNPELALFIDGSTGQPFTGSFANGSSKVGLSGRLVLNPSVKLNPSQLVVYSTSPATPSGDSTRPALLLDRLTSTTLSLGLAGGGSTALYTGSVRDFASRVIDAQGEVAASAGRLDEGQKVVQSSIESRFSSASGVNIDTELTNLVQIQNAYSANARIMSAVKEMMDLLLRL